MPNERNNRQSVPQRLATSGRNFLTREYRGARNAVPGTSNWQWQQTLDALALPGNWYNSQAPQGERWQVPGVSGLRDLFGIRDPQSGSEQPQGNWLERMFGIRQQGEGEGQASQGSRSGGAMAGLRSIFGIRDPQSRPGYTPGAGMGIMPNNPGWQPGGLLGDESINIQPNLPGTLPQGQGALMSHQAPAPRGSRPGLDTFMLMQQASAAAAERDYLNALWGERRRQK